MHLKHDLEKDSLNEKVTTQVQLSAPQVVFFVHGKTSILVINCGYNNAGLSIKLHYLNTPLSSDKGHKKVQSKFQDVF